MKDSHRVGTSTKVSFHCARQIPMHQSPKPCRDYIKSGLLPWLHPLLPLSKDITMPERKDQKGWRICPNTEFHLLVSLLNQTLSINTINSRTELQTPLSPVGLVQGPCLTNLGHMNNFPSRFCKMSSQVPSLHSLILK